MSENQQAKHHESDESMDRDKEIEWLQHLQVFKEIKNTNQGIIVYAKYGPPYVIGLYGHASNRQLIALFIDIATQLNILPLLGEVTKHMLTHDLQGNNHPPNRNLLLPDVQDNIQGEPPQTTPPDFKETIDNLIKDISKNLPKTP